MRAALILILHFISFWCIAQYNMRPNIYWEQWSFYNPASGLEDSSRTFDSKAYAKHRFSDNPLYQKPGPVLFFNHLYRINSSDNILSLSFLNDRYSFFKRKSIKAGYTRQIQISKTSSIQVGTRLVVNVDKVDLTALTYFPNDNADNAFYFMSADFDLGAEYRWKDLVVGVSGINLMNTKSRLEDKVLLQNFREFVGYISYRADLGKQFYLAPNGLFRYERGVDFDIALHFGMQNRFYIGYALRALELRHIFSTSVHIYKGFHLQAAYDFSTLRLPYDMNLDLGLRYQF